MAHGVRIALRTGRITHLNSSLATMIPSAMASLPCLCHLHPFPDQRLGRQQFRQRHEARHWNGAAYGGQPL